MRSLASVQCAPSQGRPLSRPNLLRRPWRIRVRPALLPIQAAPSGSMRIWVTPRLSGSRSEKKLRTFPSCTLITSPDHRPIHKLSSAGSTAIVDTRPRSRKAVAYAPRFHPAAAAAGPTLDAQSTSFPWSPRQSRRWFLWERRARPQTAQLPCNRSRTAKPSRSFPCDPRTRSQSGTAGCWIHVFRRFDTPRSMYWPTHSHREQPRSTPLFQSPHRGANRARPPQVESDPVLATSMPIHFPRDPRKVPRRGRQTVRPSK